MGKTPETILILHNIRSAYNVGAIFRTADAAGVSKIYLTGYAPAPTDRFGRMRKDIAKTALGAERTVAWGSAKNIGDVLEKLKEEGWYSAAVEQAPGAINYRMLSKNRKTVFVFGNEVRGLSKQVLAKCDAVAEIPMRCSPRPGGRGKESLNVSVAAGIILFR